MWSILFILTNAGRRMAQKSQVREFLGKITQILAFGLAKTCFTPPMRILLLDPLQTIREDNAISQSPLHQSNEVSSL
jgi:hypothetical protein